MTAGTSQGLFIVVAIVIFGIFVVLAYILFEDTLSPSMASMFNDAIEKSSESLHDESLITARDFIFHNRDSSISSLTFSNRGFSYLHNGNNYVDGLYIPGELLEVNTTYELSYDIKNISGTFDTLGGHINIASEKKMYVNNVEVGDYFDGVLLKVEEGETKSVRVVFTTDLLSGKQTKAYGSGVFIQPNRHYDKLTKDLGMDAENIIKEHPLVHVQVKNIKMKIVE